MVKQKAAQSPDVGIELQATNPESTSIPNVATAGGPTGETRPLEVAAIKGDTGPGHVVGEGDSGTGPFWALLRLAGYEIW